MLYLSERLDSCARLWEERFRRNCVLSKSVVVIYGATGVGKTALAEQLAQHHPVEIINMDVGQFYVPFSIGTAKPLWRQSPVQHHLFDIIDRPQNVTVIAYRELLLSKVQEVLSRGNQPIVVGGSGFYLMSLLFPPDQEHGSIGTKNTISALSANSGMKDDSLKEGSSWQQLFEIDPERARAIAPGDTYRIARALALFHDTGKKPSTFVPRYSPLFSKLHIIHVSRDRSELIDRINSRVDTMIATGLFNEVENLIGTEWEAFIRIKRLIGYDDVLAHLSPVLGTDPLTKDVAISLIKSRTRRYAKRQETFWRMLEARLKALELEKASHGMSASANIPIPTFESINLTHGTIDQYISRRSNQFQQFQQFQNCDSYYYGSSYAKQ